MLLTFVLQIIRSTNEIMESAYANYRAYYNKNLLRQFHLNVSRQKSRMSVHRRKIAEGIFAPCNCVGYAFCLPRKITQ